MKKAREIQTTISIIKKKIFIIDETSKILFLFSRCKVFITSREIEIKFVNDNQIQSIYLN